jgi:hypothetical protein
VNCGRVSPGRNKMAQMKAKDKIYSIFFNQTSSFSEFFWYSILLGVRPTRNFRDVADMHCNKMYKDTLVWQIFVTKQPCQVYSTVCTSQKFIFYMISCQLEPFFSETPQWTRNFWKTLIGLAIGLSGLAQERYKMAQMKAKDKIYHQEKELCRSDHWFRRYSDKKKQTQIGKTRP